MKYSKILLIGLLAFEVMLFSSCDDGYAAESSAGKILAGEHKLGRLNDGDSTEQYFLINDSSADTYTKTKLSFSFQLSDGSYTMATLPLDKIRVKIDEYVETPYVNFSWTLTAHADVQYIMDNSVIYMLVHCKSGHFPIDI